MASKVTAPAIVRQPRLGERDPEKAGDPGDLAGQVGEKVGEVHEEDVRQVPEPPPGGGVIEIARMRPALALPGEPAAADPERPESWMSSGQRGIGARAGAAGRRRVFVGELGIVVPERHEDVARVTDHDDVAHLGVEGQRVERHVALDEAPVRLRFERRERGVEIVVLPVEPGRDRRDGRPWRVRKDDLAQDVLHPGGSRLVGGRDDDVAGARPIAVPVAAVEDVAQIDAGAAGKHGHGGSPERRHAMTAAERARPPAADGEVGHQHGDEECHAE